MDLYKGAVDLRDLLSHAVEPYNEPKRAQYLLSREYFWLRLVLQPSVNAGPWEFEMPLFTPSGAEPKARVLGSHGFIRLLLYLLEVNFPAARHLRLQQ